MSNYRKMKGTGRRTFVLFSRPSFHEGTARVIDLGGSLQKYASEETPQKADAKAILMDWLAVGDDLRYSIKQFDVRGKERQPA